MVDINVLKKGGFNQFSNKSKAAQKFDDFALKQEEGKSPCYLYAYLVDRMGGADTLYKPKDQRVPKTSTHRNKHST